MRLWDKKQTSAAALISNLTGTEKYEIHKIQVLKAESTTHCHKVSFCWGGLGFTGMLAGLLWTPGCCFPRLPLGGTIIAFFSQPTCQLPGARHVTPLSGDQHGGHACGVAKQIALFVRLTPPESSITRAEPGRRCPNREQDGRGQQVTVPVSPRDQGGAPGEDAAAC